MFYPVSWLLFDLATRGSNFLLNICKPTPDYSVTILITVSERTEVTHKNVGPYPFQKPAQYTAEYEKLAVSTQ
jgi:hypothetical protein